MKNILWILSLSLAAASLFSSCNNEEDDIFADSSAVRLEQAKKEYTERLSATENGWAMEYYPTMNKGVRGYMLLANFYRDGSVKVAMKNELSGNQYVDSVSIWKIIADNGPVLTFDSYNPYLHLFSTPEDIKETEDEDEQGLGYEGDYEFIIVDAPENAQNIMLKGKKRGTYIRLTRMPEDLSWEEYYTKQERMQSLLFGGNVNPLILRMADQVYEVHDAATGIANIIPEGGDLIADENYFPLLVSLNGFRLAKPFEPTSGLTAQEFVYDSEKDILVCVENNGITISGVPKYEFMMQQIELSKRWQITSSSEMSEKFAVELQKVIDGIKSVNYSFVNFSLEKREDEGVQVVLNIRTNKGVPTKGGYYYNMNGSNDELKLEYSEANVQGEAYLKFGVENFVKNTLATSFTLAASRTNLNLEQIKLVSQSDPDLWVVVTLK